MTLEMVFVLIYKSVRKKKLSLLKCLICDFAMLKVCFLVHSLVN